MKEMTNMCILIMSSQLRVELYVVFPRIGPGITTLHSTLRTSLTSSEHIDYLITIMQMMHKFSASADWRIGSSLKPTSF